MVNNSTNSYNHLLLSTIPPIVDKTNYNHLVKQWWSTITPIRFVDIGGIVDHHCLEVVVIRFVDIGGIVDHPLYRMVVIRFVQYWWITTITLRGGCNSFCWYWWNWIDHHCLEVVVIRFVDIGGIELTITFRGGCNSFCWYWWNCWPSLFRGGCNSFCWYWWNCWPSPL